MDNALTPPAFFSLFPFSPDIGILASLRYSVNYLSLFSAASRGTVFSHPFLCKTISAYNINLDNSIRNCLHF